MEKLSINIFGYGTSIIIVHLRTRIIPRLITHEHVKHMYDYRTAADCMQKSKLTNQKLLFLEILVEMYRHNMYRKAMLRISRADHKLKLN